MTGDKPHFQEDLENLSEMDLLCKEYMDALYDGYSGYVAYQPGEKETFNQKKIFLTYGEILFGSVVKLINYIGLTEDDVFCDLGSGIGKMCTEVFLKSKVKKSFGVEAHVARYQDSMRIAEKVKQDLPDLFKTGRKLEFYNTNFLETDISDATVVYTCSTCFDADCMDGIANLVNNNPNIRYLVSLKKLECRLPFIEMMPINCTWDKTNCYIYGNR